MGVIRHGVTGVLAPAWGTVGKWMLVGTLVGACRFDGMGEGSAQGVSRRWRGVGQLGRHHDDDRAQTPYVSEKIGKPPYVAL